MTREIGSVERDWTRVLDRLRRQPERGWIAGALARGSRVGSRPKVDFTRSQER